jgi:hypothetical protein
LVVGVSVAGVEVSAVGDFGSTVEIDFGWGGACVGGREAGGERNGAVCSGGVVGVKANGAFQAFARASEGIPTATGAVPSTTRRDVINGIVLPKDVEILLHFEMKVVADGYYG